MLDKYSQTCKHPCLNMQMEDRKKNSKSRKGSFQVKNGGEAAAAAIP